MKPVNFFFLSIIILLLTGCTSIDYFGKYYPPTTSVDLYFSANDIKQAYEIMGQAIETADDFVSEQKMQQALKEKGCQVGADAILIESFRKIKVGETTDYNDYSDTTVHKKSHHHHKHENISTYDYGTSNTQDVTERQIKASFLKYKKQ